MDFLSLGIGIIIGIAAGAFLTWAFFSRTQKHLQDSFDALSRKALSDNSNDFLKLANATLAAQTISAEGNLNSKKQLIDQTLDAIRKELEKVDSTVTELEKDRIKKFSALDERLTNASQVISSLNLTTDQLRIALANPQARGQWGDRMAEDILRLVGFIEGVNYFKQRVIESNNKRPDYTFPLPQNLKVNMDVKFPLENYMLYIKSENDRDKEFHKNEFFKNVRKHIKDVLSRDYINPDENTVDYVIVFIPNEQIYGFINLNDNTILDEALRKKVILCSPSTLYAVLAIMRQAVDNFNLEKTASKILQLLGTFNKQWEAFIDSMDRMGDRIDAVQKEYTALKTTRKNQLEKPLGQIEALRREKHIALEDPSEQKPHNNAEIYSLESR